VARALGLLLFFALLGALHLLAQQADPPLPPEEDESYAAPREYGFNPLQAKKELNIGRFYFKKGSYKAAALRAQEALKWDDSLLEAYLMLGESRERMRDTDGARKAYQQFLELAADNAKERKDIEKRIQKLAKADDPPKPNR
jgi:outer membrane protein assembly factor BamD (BamD/ComL family)